MLRCPTSANSVGWFKDSTALRDSSGLAIAGATLAFKAVTLADAGAYYCAAGPKNYAFKLKVISKDEKGPVILEMPQNVTVDVGGDVTFNCEVIGENVEVMWSREVSPNVTEVLSRDRRLVVKNVTGGDEGWYVCFANSSYGEDSASAWLSVAQMAAKPAAKEDDYVDDGGDGDREGDAEDDRPESNGELTGWRYFRCT